VSDAVVSGVRAERSGPVDQSASPGFRRVGPMSSLQAVLEEYGLDGSVIIASDVG
jgi:hypothetical protein